MECGQWRPIKVLDLRREVIVREIQVSHYVR